ncbi:MAG: SDR family oxidoreductase [Pseudomonadales bacterium]|jgi:NAD(P)-dependent dehydrogenase (short-subunit alcohol dehydrogenase family)
MGRLSDKITVVVGAGQTPGDTIGNGRATAIRFAQEDAVVVCVDLNRASAEETLGMIEEAGGTGLVIEADVTREAACEGVIAEVEEAYGRIDVLHNNIGIGRGDSGATKMSEAAWDAIFDTNLKSIMFLCKHALPGMRARGSGVITNISSVAAVCAVGIVAYKTSKAALNAYTHALATANARFGIRANVIMPGLMNTPMAIEGNVAAGADRQELIARRNAQVPLGGRMGSAWDVANAALFLASDEAAFITGVNLPVDGGQSARIG